MSDVQNRADPEPAGRHFSPKLLIRGLAWDIGLPLVAYYGLHALGLDFSSGWQVQS